MNTVEAALYSVLVGNGTLVSQLGGSAVYNHLAPRTAALPYVIFSQQSGREDDETPRRTVSYRYLVKAVGSTLASAGTIADQIDTVLHDVALTGITGWTNYWLHRETTIRYIEPSNAGDNIGHAGAIYTIRISE